MHRRCVIMVSHPRVSQKQTAITVVFYHRPVRVLYASIAALRTSVADTVTRRASCFVEVTTDDHGYCWIDWTLRPKNPKQLNQPTTRKLNLGIIAA